MESMKIRAVERSNFLNMYLSWSMLEVTPMGELSLMRKPLLVAAWRPAPGEATSRKEALRTFPAALSPRVSLGASPSTLNDEQSLPSTILCHEHAEMVVTEPETRASRKNAGRALRVPTVTPLTHFLLSGGIAAAVIAASLNPTLSAFTAQITNNSNVAGSGALIMEERSGENGGGTYLYCSSDGRGDTAIPGTPTTFVTDTAPVGDNAVDCKYSLFGGNMKMAPGMPATTQTIHIKNPTGPAALDANLLTMRFGNCVAVNQATTTSTPAAPNLCNQISANVVAVRTSNSVPTTATVIASTPLAAMPATALTILNKTAAGSFASGVTVPPGDHIQFRVGVTFPSSANDNLVQNQRVSQDITWQFSQ